MEAGFGLIECKEVIHGCWEKVFNTRRARLGLVVHQQGENVYAAAEHLLLNHPDPSHGVVLATRFYFDREHHSLVDVKFNITFTRKIRADYYKTDALKLVRSESPMLVVGSTIQHIIDEASPLHGQTVEKLAENRAWFFVSVQGIEATTMQTVFFSGAFFAAARNSDTVNPDGDVVDGTMWKFRGVHTRHPHTGKFVVDFHRMDQLDPIQPTDEEQAKPETLITATTTGHPSANATMSTSTTVRNTLDIDFDNKRSSLAQPLNPSGGNTQHQ